MNATIEHNFKFHPSSPTSVEQDAIRAKAKELAILIDEQLPLAAGREKAIAITKVEEAMWAACAGVCRYPKKITRPGHD